VVKFQPIYDIAEICFRHGITQAVLCPGSRCAPLTLAFARHPKITARTFSDERSAAFVGMGIAQQTNTPVVLVCTSGSAAYNFSPAVAEAYFQQIPLLIFTADRAVEWVDQYDGQTIHQQAIYGTHVKKSFQLPPVDEHPDTAWHINRVVNEAIQLSRQFPSGPVHINAPFREPFYPAKSENISFSKEPRIIEVQHVAPILANNDVQQLKQKLGQFNKVLVVAGQHDYDDALIKSLEKFSKHQKISIVGDVISNLHASTQTIRHVDAFLGQCGEDVKKSLRPELLITFGKSVISKNLKIFLRQHRAVEHWYVQSNGAVADTFQTITKNILTTPSLFFEGLSEAIKNSDFETQKRENYLRLWEAEEHRTQRSLKSFFATPVFGEFYVIHEFIKSLPPRCNLHLANSMTVRYANFISLEAGKKGIHVFSNRGTSGIDGCTSTAMGHTLVSDVPNFLITGDMAFFYDRNAFWHNYDVPNLHVFLINNHGGIIFNLIDGPGNLPERDEFFVTEQRLSGQNLANEFGIDYSKIETLKQLKNGIKNFLEFDGKTKVLEIDTERKVNAAIFDKFLQHVKKGYET
jgi:2-succinyl-5-enolpyruvyl-6-hydroxy-3-cyclohexene-1-carboxylate synthase